MRGSRLGYLDGPRFDRARTIDHQEAERRRRRERWLWPGGAPPGEGVAYLLRDVFSGANGEDIDTHPMDVGPGWDVEVAGGGGTIQGNQYRSGDGTRILSDAGTGDVDISVTFTLPVADASHSAGVILRRQDSNNHWLFQVVGNGAIRILDLVVGSYTIRDPDTWSADTLPHTLRAVAVGQELSLYLDDVLKCTWVSGFLELETEHGLRGNTGVTFDDFAAVSPSLPTAGADLLLLGIGDSIMAGAIGNPNVCRRLGAALTALRDWGTVGVINRGYSGSNTAEWLAGSTHLTRALAAAEAAGLFNQPFGLRPVQVMLGTNDAADAIARSTVDVQTNLLNLATALRAAGLGPILVHSPPDFEAGVFTGFGAAALTRVRDYLTACQNVVAALGGDCALGDTQARTYFATHPSELADGLHQNDTGQATLSGFWAEAWEGVLP